MAFLGRAQYATGEFDKAAENLRKAAVLLEEVFGAESPQCKNIRQLLSEALEQVGAAAYDSGRFAAAIEPLADRLRLSEEVHGKQHWKTADARRELWKTSLLARLGPEEQRRVLAAKESIARFAAAETREQLERSLAEAQQALGVFRAHFGECADTVIVRGWQAYLNYKLGNIDAAMPLSQQSVGLRSPSVWGMAPALRQAAGGSFDALPLAERPAHSHRISAAGAGNPRASE